MVTWEEHQAAIAAVEALGYTVSTTFGGEVDGFEKDGESLPNDDLPAEIQPYADVIGEYAAQDNFHGEAGDGD